jgi:hypothetical protein
MLPQHVASFHQIGKIKGCSWLIRLHIWLKCMTYHLPWLLIQIRHAYIYSSNHNFHLLIEFFCYKMFLDNEIHVNWVHIVVMCVDWLGPI